MMKGGIALSAICKYSYGLYYIIFGSVLLIAGAWLVLRGLAHTGKNRADLTAGETGLIAAGCGQEETQLLDDGGQETAWLDEETVWLRNKEETTMLLQSITRGG